jgi:hypothetical protein
MGDAVASQAYGIDAVHVKVLDIEQDRRRQGTRVPGAAIARGGLKDMWGVQFGMVAVATCVAAAGCASAPLSSPVTPAAAVQPTRPVSASGTYNGITQLVQGPAMSCGTQDMLTLHVVGNTFGYILNQPQVSWQPVRSFNVVIAPDGSFQAQSGTAYIRGTVSGSHMAGDIVGDACAYHFEADSSGTF